MAQSQRPQKKEATQKQKPTKRGTHNSLSNQWKNLGDMALFSELPDLETHKRIPIEKANSFPMNHLAVTED